MAEGVRFLIAQAALILLGIGAAWHPSARSLSAPARAAVCFCAGAAGLVVEATVFSLLGIPWSIAGLALPLLILSALAWALWRRRPAPPRLPMTGRRGVLLASAIACAVALLYLAVSFFSSSATSVDFLFFWGVKAVKFADARGIDASFLRYPFAIHASLDYPPLVPIVQAWGAMAAGRMPWRAVPLLSALWAAAAIPIVFERGRRRLGDDGAAVLTAFWTVALSVSLVHSHSAGAAEPTIVFFETVAVVWLLTETAGEPRFVAAAALCGAALTKVEGLVAALLVVLGVWLRDRSRGTPRPAVRAALLAGSPIAAVGLWFLYQWSRSLEVGYRAHGDFLTLYLDQAGTVFVALLRNLDSGSFWLPWAFAVLLIIRRPRQWRSVAPALTLAGGLMAFLAFDYLHDKDDPAERIVWTAPRVTQPALSAAILAAGMLSLGRIWTRDPKAAPP
jgi:hypothetical protein